MARKLQSDKVLFTTTILLVALSVVMVYSASAAVALDRHGSASMFLIKQGMWAVLGIAMLYVVMRIDYRVYREPVFIWTCLAGVSFALVAVYFSSPVNGARRWFGVGGIGVQPSEFAKLALVLFLADLLSRRMDKVNELSSVVAPVGIVVGGLVGLTLMQPDFGTSAFLVMLAVVMIFAAGLHYRYLLGVVACGLPAAAALILLSPRREERLERIMMWINPWSDAAGGGFQIIQSFIAVGSGGFSGRGFMQGLQKIGFLPESNTDFIYAVIGEELGLVGATIVLACFCVIAWRGLRTAMRAPDRFGAFLALGLTAMIVVQAFFNISVVLGLLPTKGIPLPFVSFGGSSLLMSMIGMGILLNVSQHASASHVVTTVLEPLPGMTADA
jgi:cell division protein FtsW